MCLLINSSISQVKSAVSTPTPFYFEKAIASAMRFDVGRTLISGALNNREFVEDPYSFEDGSVGEVIRNLLNVLFPAETAQSLPNSRDFDAYLFDCALQGRFRLFLNV